MLRRLALLFPLATAMGCGPQEASKPLVILAASSLEPIVNVAASRWSAESDVPLRLQFAASSTLSRQIQKGATADVFLSAHSHWVKDLPSIAEKEWLGNRLVWISAARGSKPDLSAPASLVLGSPEVPVGLYAAEALKSLKIPLPDRIVYGLNARDVVAKIAQGAAELGITYATDAKNHRRVEAIGSVPPAVHPPIRYTVVLLSERGRPFFETLEDEAVSERAKAMGFLLQ